MWFYVTVMSFSLLSAVYSHLFLTIFHSPLSQVHWLRKRSLLNPNKILEERHSLSFPGNRSHAIVPGLKPFSEYRLTVNVFNKKGNGPNSDPVTFNTPEGGEVYWYKYTAHNIYMFLMHLVYTLISISTQKQKNTLKLATGHLNWLRQWDKEFKQSPICHMSQCLPF